MTSSTLVTLIAFTLLLLTWLVPYVIRKRAKNKKASEYYDAMQLANVVGVVLSASATSFFVANLLRNLF